MYPIGLDLRVRRNRNDAADAAAICETAGRPASRFGQFPRRAGDQDPPAPRPQAQAQAKGRLSDRGRKVTCTVTVTAERRHIGRMPKDSA